MSIDTRGNVRRHEEPLAYLFYIVLDHKCFELFVIAFNDAKCVYNRFRSRTLAFKLKLSGK